MPPPITDANFDTWVAPGDESAGLKNIFSFDAPECRQGFYNVQQSGGMINSLNWLALISTALY